MNHAERIAAAEKRAKDAKLALLKARRAASSQQRRDLTRAKIILGGGAIAAGEDLVNMCLALATERDRAHVLSVLRPTPPPPTS